MKAAVEPELCIGCGACQETCPQVFRMRGDVAKAGEVRKGLESACLQAMEECFMGAILIEEEATDLVPEASLPQPR